MKIVKSYAPESRIQRSQRVRLNKEVSALKKKSFKHGRALLVAENILEQLSFSDVPMNKLSQIDQALATIKDARSA